MEKLRVSYKFYSLNRFQTVSKELEEKSVAAENDISELKTDVEGARMNLMLMNSRIKKNTEGVKELNEELEKLKAGSGTATVAPVSVSIPEGGNFDIS